MKGVSPVLYTPPPVTPIEMSQAQLFELVRDYIGECRQALAEGDTVTLVLRFNDIELVSRVMKTKAEMAVRVR